MKPSLEDQLISLYHSIKDSGQALTEIWSLCGEVSKHLRVIEILIAAELVIQLLGLLLQS